MVVENLCYPSKVPSHKSVSTLVFGWLIRFTNKIGDGGGGAQDVRPYVAYFVKEGSIGFTALCTRHPDLYKFSYACFL